MSDGWRSAQPAGWKALQKVAVVAVSIAVVVACLFFAWVGFTESDDLMYANAAAAWVQQPPFLAENHWGLRHCLVLPMAALFWLFGQSETTLLLPTLMYAAGFLALLAYITWRLHGWFASAVVVAIAGTVPVIATGASFVSTDLPEAFFVVASLWAFYRGLRSPGPAMMLWSGILAGFALITRETSVALIGLYVVLYALNYGDNRSGYRWLALGTAVIVGLDWVYLTSLSGDPLYRLHIALRGVHGDGPQMENVVSKTGGLDHFGTLDVARWLRPLVAVFANQNFGLLPWLAVPATVWLVLRGSERAGPGVALIGGLALTWFVVIGYLLMHWLWVIPRYYVVCVVLAVPLAIVAADAVSVRRTRLAFALLALVAGSGVLLNLGATTDQMAGERALVAFARGTTEPIRTDPATERGARWLLDRHGIGDRVSVGLPEHESLYFFNNRPRRRLPVDWPVPEPPAGWIRVETFDVPSKWTRFLVTGFGLSWFLPAGLLMKLDPAPHVIGVYRAPAA